MTNIFIANLDWVITSEDLMATFSAFGEVHLAHVVFDAKTKKSKGFGYVEMESAEQAINAIQALNGFEVNGRKLTFHVQAHDGIDLVSHGYHERTIINKQQFMDKTLKKLTLGVNL
jgi:RNA recognition motif-containing protein